MNTVIRCFLDVDMRCQHFGLSKHAKKHKVDIDKLKPGQHVMFTNRAMNRVKIYSAGGVLSYLASKDRLDMAAVGQIPACFGADIQVKYASAIKRIFLAREIKKGRRAAC